MEMEIMEWPERVSMMALYESSECFRDDPMVVRIRKNVDRYNALGMGPMWRKAIEGGVAYVLSKFNMKLLHVTAPNIDRESELRTVRYDGGRVRYRHKDGYKWEQCLLCDFEEPVPSAILDRLPSNWGVEASVFYPVRGVDPIIAVPIGQRAVRTFWFKRQSGMYAAVFKWE